MSYLLFFGDGSSIYMYFNKLLGLSGNSVTRKFIKSVKEYAFYECACFLQASYIFVSLFVREYI